MLLKNILSCTPTTFSFEFFPPKTDTAWEHLFHTIADLMPLSPSWVSVTYGAGGTTRENTHRLVVRLNKQTDLTVVSHLTCVASTREDIHAILDHYEANGIDNILALRGDPRGTDTVDGGPRRIPLCIRPGLLHQGPFSPHVHRGCRFP